VSFDRKEYLKGYRKANKERIALRQREYQFKVRYGITIAEFDEMLEAQGGHCAACPSTKKLSVDHNHETGVVRAILCHNCNCTIGYAQEDTARLAALIVYLESHDRHSATTCPSARHHRRPEGVTQ
jgi:hypothetical protein